MKKPKQRNKFIIFGAVAAVFILVAVFGKNAKGLFSPVSIVSSAVRLNLQETDGRTNVLVLGVDRRTIGTEGGLLTDTLLFASIDNSDGSVALISLPRDLWVKADAGKGPHFMKINAVYSVDGVEELRHVVGDILGMPVHYYAVVDFNLFKETIDTLGGVRIDVEHAFVDYSYPIEGREADTCELDEKEIEEGLKKIEEEGIDPVQIFSCRYQTVAFEAGSQIMDGETALKYVRSRHGTNGEGDDFARSRRQQRIIMAVKDKALQLETILDIGKVKELYEVYSKNVDTNISLDSVQGFWTLSQRVDFNEVRSIVLDDQSGTDEGGILYHPVDTNLYGGSWVLVPRSGDYSQIRAYVQKYVFGE